MGFTLASSRQRLSCRITHCKTDKKFFWKSGLKHFFLVLSYEIYFSLNSYSTKHASQKGSHRPESEDAVYGLKLIKLSIYINHPESVKTTGFHIRVIYTRFTTLIQLIKSCKNNKKTLFSSECTQRRQSRASTTGDPNGFMLSGSRPSDPA